MSHVSVLLNEVLGWLDLKPGMTIVDATLGRGGHALEILKKIAPDGILLGFDKDASAIDESKKVLEACGDRAMLFNEDFKNIPERLTQLGQKADGLLLDLGVSSPQLDDASRGFSFKADGPLDMRMDTSKRLTAEEIINSYPEKELADIFWKYGEERYSRRIADKISNTRERHRIRTTLELASLVTQCVGGSYRRQRIHPATRVFQALRIVVNSELESLQLLLQNCLDVMSIKGRVVVISFHSLEDRIVKNIFRDCAKNELGVVLTKKPLVAGHDEIQENPRARSAKLRVFQKA